MAYRTLHTEAGEGVRHIVFDRASEYNTITPELLDDPFEDHGSRPKPAPRGGRP